MATMGIAKIIIADVDKNLYTPMNRASRRACVDKSTLQGNSTKLRIGGNLYISLQSMVGRVKVPLQLAQTPHHLRMRRNESEDVSGRRGW